jgi:hypothetical protein
MKAILQCKDGKILIKDITGPVEPEMEFDIGPPAVFFEGNQPIFTKQILSRFRLGKMDGNNATFEEI